MKGKTKIYGIKSAKIRSQDENQNRRYKEKTKRGGRRRKGNN
jgi:hypothetical protein